MASNFKQAQTAADLVRILDLKPHPEGGFYRESYRSAASLPRVEEALSGRERAVSTAIYFLLTADTFSEMHSLTADEIFHFYLGDAVELLRLCDDGSSEIVRIGSDLAAGEIPQLVLNAGEIFGCRVRPGGDFALLGCTVAPGFDFADYRQWRRTDLVERFPERRELICALTRV